MSKIIEIGCGISVCGNIDFRGRVYRLDSGMNYLELVSGPYDRRRLEDEDKILETYFVRDVNSSSPYFGKTGYSELPMNSKSDIFPCYSGPSPLLRMTYAAPLQQCQTGNNPIGTLSASDLVQVVSGPHNDDLTLYFVVVKSSKDESLQEKSGFIYIPVSEMPPGQKKTKFAEVTNVFPKENKKMSDNKMPILTTLKTDATDAAWRTAGSQLVKATRDPLAALLMRHLGPEDDALRGKIGAFLQTELGASMLSALLSVGLSTMPQTDVTQKLSRELRIRAMAGTSDVMADVFMQPLREVMATALRDVVPAIPKTLPDAHGISSVVAEVQHDPVKSTV